jgi:hypothetical protein
MLVNFRAFFVCFLSLFLFACGSQESQTDFKSKPPLKTELDSDNVYVISGDYYEMKMGVKGNELTGVYKDPSAKNKNACLFFFEGIIGNKNPVKVKCYNPVDDKPPFNGYFKILGDVMIVKLDKNPANKCESEFIDETGHSLVLDKQANWSAVRMIQQKTPLYEDAEGGLTTGNLLTKGTIVAVLEKRNTWLRIEAQNGYADEGWIQEYMLYPLLEL